jgi:hypothetical protein
MKKIVNIDKLLLKWDQLLTILYRSILDGKEDDFLDDYDLISEGKHFDPTFLVHNMRMILRDRRWHWSKEFTPLTILAKIPKYHRWVSYHDIGQVPGDKRNITAIIEDATDLAGSVVAIELRPREEMWPMKGGWVDLSTHMVLFFESDDDCVFFKLKYT